MKIRSVAIKRIVDDFGRAQLGDPRRTRRIQRVAAKLAKSPAVPLPEAMGCSADLEGAYRIVNNQNVTFDKLVDGHGEGTKMRAEAARDVLVIHDTTLCTFPHLDPKEVGYLTTGKAGFPLHLSLVIDAASWRRPLGIIHAEALFRAKRSAGKGKGGDAKGKEREYDRWWRGMQASSEALDKCNSVIHVADCEGDSYELMANLLLTNQRFVIRVRVGDRRGNKADDDQKARSTVRELARSCEGVLERDVPLTSRKKHKLNNQSKAHPPRKARIARLRFAATTVVITRPQRLPKSLPDTLELNLAHVFEPDPPAGESAVEWLLYTTEPIENAEQIARVVENYRARWTIEEYNAALKTGCAYEARHFESRDGLLTMLAISLPVACELLWLRSRARTSPQRPATEVLTPLQIEILRKLGPKKISVHPTVRDALLAVAALGGHVKANGEPGWKVLQRGFTRLLDYQTGWIAAGRTSGQKEATLPA